MDVLLKVICCGFISTIGKKSAQAIWKKFYYCYRILAMSQLQCPLIARFSKYKFQSNWLVQLPLWCLHSTYVLIFFVNLEKVRVLNKKLFEIFQNLDFARIQALAWLAS